MTTTVVAAFLFLFPVGALAEAPKISSFLLNSKAENVTFNPNNGEKMNISITTDKPVKFNTVAVCLANDSVCSRSTSVKYFVQYDSFSVSISKDWDGKTGGSSPVIIGTGEYKIKATIKDESGEEANEFGQFSILVDLSTGNFGGDEEDDASLENSSTTASTTTSTTASSTSVDSNIKIVTRTIVKYVSVHSSPENLSEYEESPILEASAGRERMVYVGAPVEFSGKYKFSKGECLYKDFVWSFGDGKSGFGEETLHTYKFPGEYSVVLNVSCADKKAVSRTIVKVLVPEISLSTIPSGDLKIVNFGDTEINLGEWKLNDSLGNFTFPGDTVIGAGKEIILSQEYSKIYSNFDGVSLFDPSGKLVAKTFVSSNTKTDDFSSGVSTSSLISEIGIDREQAERFVSEFKRLSNIKKDNLDSERGLVVEILDETNGSTTSSVGNTDVATVSEAGNPSPGFLRKLFSLPMFGIKAVARVFYDFE